MMEFEAIRAMIEVEKEHPWYRARFNFVKVLLKNRSFHNTRILDFGCGSGEVLSECKKIGFREITGMDTSSECIKSAQSKGLSNAILIEDLPLLKKEYDLILCLDVLEHLENDSDCLTTLRNGLRDNGKILITVPAHPFLWSSHDVFNHHFRRYTRKSLMELVATSGMQIDSIRFWNSLLFPIFVIMRPLSQILRRRAASEFSLPPKFLRPILFLLLSFETKSTVVGFLPGVSLVAILSNKSPE